MNRSKWLLVAIKEPYYIDLDGARVGIITGGDYMSPKQPVH